MTRKHFHLVDVFTNRMFGGNPLAVFTDGEGLSSETMQLLAKEMNLSETTFVLPPEDPQNQYKVRIFTPGKELPMAGHPTVGTAYVLVHEDMLSLPEQGGEITLEEGVGPIKVSISMKGGEADMIWMTQLNPRFGATVEARESVAEMLSLSPDDINADLPVEVVSCGVPFVYVPVRTLDAMHRISYRLDVGSRLLSPLGIAEVFAFSTEVENEGSTVHSRMFAPEIGVWEDPATGAASGPLGSYLVRHGVVQASPVANIISEQGLEMGRPSFIHIRIEQEDTEIMRVQVGGQVVYVGEGDVEISG